ncbi:MAG: hypothetical protein HY381_00285 [Candidatus Chisholmbacteria bacterium]|nr:hypothetical protein [Candidatus Chisholmbacteria bacterium]
MKLKIDTTNNRETQVSLGGKAVVKEYKSPQEQDVLAVIDEVLKREDKLKQDITVIEVNRGPGAFTSLRVGVTLANALGYALGVAVNGKKGKVVEPVYGEVGVRVNRAAELAGINRE